VIAVPVLKIRLDILANVDGSFAGRYPPGRGSARKANCNDDQGRRDKWREAHGLAIFNSDPFQSQARNDWLARAFKRAAERHCKPSLKINKPPTAAAPPPEFDLLSRIVFNYGMNYKGATGLPGVAYGTNFNATSIVNPSAFVFLSDVRARSTETPFYGSNPGNEIGCSHCWLAQISSRHVAGADLNFADGHVAYFKYTYLCSNAVTKAADPGRSDVNWTYNGQRVP
jgi:hypothetical protein